MKKKGAAKTVALWGMLIALGLVFGYIEHLVPLPIGIYGIKLGLSNLVTLVALYTLGAHAAIYINLIRIFLSSLLFGNAVSLAYSLAGGLTAVIIMIIAKKIWKFGTVGVSVLGGLTHNLAQLAVAVFMVNNLKIAFYLPVLIAAGAVTGFIIGTCAIPIIKNRQKS
ncbi:MAG: Gx transporter family protein [Ruminococcaceae bacterium]|nr:Gx transporter family protein [Oscillospiraceae bacterium]